MLNFKENFKEYRLLRTTTKSREEKTTKNGDVNLFKQLKANNYRDLNIVETYCIQ